jgi:hypothetical protein
MSAFTKSRQAPCPVCAVGPKSRHQPPPRTSTADFGRKGLAPADHRGYFISMEKITRKQALALGLKRYFTGKPCCRGHIVERLVSAGTCVECRRLMEQSPKGRERFRRYASSPLGRERQWRYDHSPSRRERRLARSDPNPPEFDPARRLADGRQ